MALGTIKKIVGDKGFGFITEDKSGGKDIFFHASSVQDVEFDTLQEGDSVEFSTTTGDKGPRADNVRLIAK